LGEQISRRALSFRLSDFVGLATYVREGAAMTADNASLFRLVEFYTELGHQVAARPNPDDVLGAIAEVAVQAVPGAQYASITRGRGDGFETVASTHEAAVAADRLQYQLGSGPCVDAVIKDGVFCTPNLRQDDRWPAYGRLAAELVGVHSVLSIRLLFEDDEMAAGLNLYSTEREAYDETSRTVGQLLAVHGALAISLISSQQKATHLEKALATNREIGMAMGILMAQHKITRQQAWDLLRIASQHTHRKVHPIARDVIDTGTLDLPYH
jgi:transcriptional regulator with GAF, ATPase, and Fis domain